MEKLTTYLGDGLYASFDGYQIALKANDPNNPTDTVYLDEKVTEAFVKFLDKIKEVTSSSSET